MTISQIAILLPRLFIGLVVLYALGKWAWAVIKSFQAPQVKWIHTGAFYHGMKVYRFEMDGREFSSVTAAEEDYWLRHPGRATARNLLQATTSIALFVGFLWLWSWGADQMESYRLKEYFDSLRNAGCPLAGPNELVTLRCAALLQDNPSRFSSNVLGFFLGPTMLLATLILHQFLQFILRKLGILKSKSFSLEEYNSRG